MNPLIAFSLVVASPGGIAFFAGILLVSSALAVIASSHQTRNMYRELQVLQQEQDNCKRV